MNTVAVVYLAFVGVPLSWAIRPGVEDSSWSMETTSPGLVTGGIVLMLLGAWSARACACS